MFVRFAILLAMLVSGDDAPASSPKARFCVVVNASSDVSSLTRTELSAIFMKRKRSWANRSEIVPVDQPAKSKLRDDFSKAVHGKNSAYVIRYWQRLIFSGRSIPPRELASDAAVLEFVKETEGAIGYVACDAALGDGVKVVQVKE